MDKRRDIEALLDKHEADGIIVTSLPDIRWCCGFSGSNGLFLLTANEAHFITDGRYEEQSEKEVTNATIHISEVSLFQFVEESQLLSGIERVIVQADHMTLVKYEDLKHVFPDKRWVSVPGLFERLRSVKSPAEMECIRRAQSITDSVFSDLLSMIKVGMAEKEVAAELVYLHMQRGAESMSFEPIVASGPNSSLPHARPGDRMLKQGDVIVIDMGCVVDGYASDMTRTVVLGKPEPEVHRVYAVVLEAQQKALESASAQLSSRELDACARDVIDAAGFGTFFSHSLGHGVGLEIHEWPSVSWRSDVLLQTGVVVTIEPGIYLPGKFGVRIEDMVQLTDSGCDNLTASAKDLIVL